MWKDFLARHALVFLLFFSASSFKWLKRLFFINFSSVSSFFGRLFAHLYETKNRGFVRYLFCYKSLFVGLHKFLRTVSGTLPFFSAPFRQIFSSKGRRGLSFSLQNVLQYPTERASSPRRALPAAGWAPRRASAPMGRTGGLVSSPLWRQSRRPCGAPSPLFYSTKEEYRYAFHRCYGRHICRYQGIPVWEIPCHRHQSG